MDKDPYDDDEFGFGEWERQLDEARIQDNKNLIYCDRYPERTVTRRNYKCGEYRENYLKED